MELLVYFQINFFNNKILNKKWNFINNILIYSKNIIFSFFLLFRKEIGLNLYGILYKNFII